MMQCLAVFFLALGLPAAETAVITTILDMNASHLRGHLDTDKAKQEGSYGKNACRCVGIDNLKGYYATQVDHHHVQYPAEAGASCAAWDEGSHPECKGKLPPEWCKTQWCYVDPCSCDIDVLPKMTAVGVEYQGSPAYYSYDTCGSTDFFTQDNKDACANQKSKGGCEQKSKCAWDGKQCGGKEVVKTCKEVAKKDVTTYGQEDCRCIGLGGKDIGKAFMYINDTNFVQYHANVGATCQAWESNAHPDCLKKDGEKPSWCSSKWCFVDPCKCKSKVPPKAVMSANKEMRFQGKTAYWSYDTCGSEDTWILDHKGQYCPSQESEKACSKLSKCAWNGKECLGKALVDICAKQEETGMLGVEAPLQSATLGLLLPLKALLVVLGVSAGV